MSHRPSISLNHFFPAKARSVLFAIITWLLYLSPGRTADLQRLTGHIPAAAARLAPVGRLDGTKRLQISISLPARNPDGLSQLLHDLYDPASPQYRHFLTPEQFAGQFGPTKESYQALVDFAKASGLTINVTHSNRLVLSVEGSVTDIEKTFHVTMQVYRHPTEPRQFYAPNQEPSVNFSQRILHISGLTNYALPHSNVRLRPAGLPRNTSDQVVANFGSGPSSTYGGNDFRAAYVPGTTLTGAGQSVALLEFDGYYPSDITSYETQFGLPNVSLVNIPIDGGVTTIGAGNGEVALDIEMVIAMAPGVSTIYVYESANSWIDMLNRMATDNLARQLSCSWSLNNGAADPAAETIFQQMAAQGQSFFAASGDSDAYTGLIPFPADSPSITLVGGTTLITNGTSGTYSSESAWNWGSGMGSGGGVSTNYTLPSWQQGISMANNLGSTIMRNVPDVALTADNIYVIYNNGRSGSSGGTSAAAPLWAAFTALVNQQAVANGRPTVGFLNPTLYNLALGSSYAADFHDVTTGNNFGNGTGNKFTAVTGYDLATGLGSPTAALITALAGPSDALVVTGTDLAALGPVGGPFNPADATYMLRNSGTSALNWTISSSQPWLTASPASGTLNPGNTTTVTISPNNAAGSLTVGTYSSMLNIADTTSGVTQTRPASLIILGAPNLTVSPSAALDIEGNVNGPFAPASVTYTLTNTGAPSLNWTASNSSSWLTLSNTSGTLAAGASTTIAASVASNSLGLGSYTDSIVFANATNGAGNTSLSATLNITNRVLVPQPSQSSTYAVSGWTRGYWFTAPASFVIAGLEVPPDASGGKQSIAVLKLTGTPPTYSSTTSNFTTLFLTQGNTAAGIIPVNIPVNQGDIIGILGYRDEINSYGTAPFTTQILGQPVTFSRLGMDYPLDTSAPQSIWTETTTNYLGRVSMYITGNTAAPIITSAFSVSGYMGQPLSYQISATNSPASYNAVGLPAGLNINTITGLISGTPSSAGTSNVTISATNATGAGTATLTLTISDAPTLSNLALSAGALTPIFTSSTTRYSASVPNAVSAIKATPIPTDSNASVMVNGVAVTSGASSAPIDLAVGGNVINIAVTAQDGVTTKAYAVTVTRGDAVITTQSGSQTVSAGGAATFAVSVTGTGPFTYQWYYNGTSIQGATSATYMLNGVSQSNAGNYWVVVTNVYGQTTSSTYTLALSQDVPAMPAWGYGVLSAFLLWTISQALQKRRPIAS